MVWKVCGSVLDGQPWWLASAASNLVKGGRLKSASPFRPDRTSLVKLVNSRLISAFEADGRVQWQHRVEPRVLTGSPRTSMVRPLIERMLYQRKPRTTDPVPLTGCSAFRNTNSSFGEIAVNVPPHEN